MAIEEGFSEHFHPDPEKMVDATQKGFERARNDEDVLFDELMEKLEKNPDDREALRQANLLVNRLNDFIGERETKN